MLQRMPFKEGKGFAWIVKPLSIGSLSVFLLLASCGKDDENPNSLSPTEAKTTLSTFNTSAKSDLQALANAEGVKAMQDFFDLTSLDDPFGRMQADKKGIKQFLRARGKRFDAVFNPGAVNGRTERSTPFNYDQKKGIYEWSASEEQFIKTGTSDIIIVRFPASGSTTNNAELQLLGYRDVAVYDDFFEEYFYEPTFIKAKVFVGGSQKASLDLSVTYDDTGFPKHANIALSFVPFTSTLVFDTSGATSSTLSFSLLKDQETLISTSIAVKYKDSSKSYESMTTVEGHIQLKNLKLKGSIDVQAANAEVVDWNKVLSLALYTETDKKIGDIVMVEETDGPVAYLKYRDGSKEKLETVFKPVIDELEDLFESLGG